MKLKGAPLALLWGRTIASFRGRRQTHFPIATVRPILIYSQFRGAKRQTNTSVLPLSARPAPRENVIPQRRPESRRDAEIKVRSVPLNCSMMIAEFPHRLVRPLHRVYRSILVVVILSAAAAARAQTPTDAAGRDPARDPAGMLTRIQDLTNGLDLTADQRSQIDDMFKQAHDDLVNAAPDLKNASADDKAGKYREILDDLRQQIAGVLTDDQKQSIAGKDSIAPPRPNARTRAHARYPAARFKQARRTRISAAPIRPPPSRRQGRCISRTIQRKSAEARSDGRSENESRRRT